MKVLNLLALLYTHAMIDVIFAEPIQGPDISSCRPTLFADNTTVNCCAPNSATVVDFQPPHSAVLRVRSAAHLLDDTYIEKYKNATALMRKLDPGHPWNFIQQANVHCAYCDGHYNQSGYNVSFRVHQSWLFFPFHRGYLYFYERILGKLIGDDNFALPFWNWDSPDGMEMPSVYTDHASSLFDVTRDPDHQPPNVVDLGFEAEAISGEAKIVRNLQTMHGQMVREGKTAELFIGGRYRAGDEEASGGSLENGAHSMVHVWTGGDMSTFDTSGKDPLFYAHHANVDRMWELWKDLPGGDRKNFNDTDWLDTSFLFWDENQQLVRIRVSDLLDTQSLGYTYQSVPIAWVNETNKPDIVGKPEANIFTVKDFPIILDSSVSVEVTRPGTMRKNGSREEVLVVDEIELEASVLAKFDVYVSAAANVEFSSSQLAGSFMRLATRTRRSNVQARMKTALKLGLTDLLEDIKATEDESIVVSLIPRTTNANITVGSIRVRVSA